MVKKNIVNGLYMVFLSSLLLSCQQIFTYSFAEPFQRDLSSLSSEQKLAAAESLKGSGNVEAAAAAYEALKSDPSSSAQLMASEMALEASGLGTVLTNPEVTSLLNGDGDGSGTDDLIASVAGSLDSTMLANSSKAFEASLTADSPVEPTQDQYQSAAIATAGAVILNDPGITAEPEDEEYKQQVQDALTDTLKSDESIDTTEKIEAIESAEEFDSSWTEAQKTIYYASKSNLDAEELLSSQ